MSDPLDVNTGSSQVNTNASSEHASAIPVADTALLQRMLKLQAFATLAVSLCGLLIGGQHAATSALLGGLSVIVGAWFAGKIAQKGQHKTDATAVLLNLLKAEAVKIIIVALFLFVTFKSYHGLIPVALIAGLAGSALFSGAALAKSQAKI